jgi:excisionase family DNA binding protein
MDEYYYNSGNKALIEKISALLDIKLDEFYERITSGTATRKVTLEEDIMTVTEVSKYLNVTRVTIHNWVKNKHLQSFKKGNQRYFYKEDVKSFYTSGRFNTIRFNYPKSDSPYYKEVNEGYWLK